MCDAPLRNQRLVLVRPDAHLLLQTYLIGQQISDCEMRDLTGQQAWLISHLPAGTPASAPPPGDHHRAGTHSSSQGLHRDALRRALSPEECVRRSEELLVTSTLNFSVALSSYEQRHHHRSRLHNRRVERCCNVYRVRTYPDSPCATRGWRRPANAHLFVR